MTSNFRQRIQFLFMACVVTAHVHAALPDEIQVYTDDINAPGEKGLELHVNTTPKGITTPGYAGETMNHHGLRVTPELSLGITKTTEVGLYLPRTRTSEGPY